MAFAVHNNHASIAVMEKIGMQKDVGAEFDHPLVPADFGHLKPQVLYRVIREMTLFSGKIADSGPIGAP